MWMNFDEPQQTAEKTNHNSLNVSARTAKSKSMIVANTEPNSPPNTKNTNKTAKAKVTKTKAKTKKRKSKSNKSNTSTKSNKTESNCNSNSNNGKRASLPALGASAEEETNCLHELHRGSALLKYPRRSGFPHFKHVQLSKDNLRIQWFSKRKTLKETCIWIKDIRDVVQGQDTEVFKKFHQKTLEKSSFSIVYGHRYATLDVAAKSIDECEMWVRSLRKLVELHKSKSVDITQLKVLKCGIHFKDRNRPMSRAGSGKFMRANNSKTLKIDPMALREIERDMEGLHKTYQKVAQMSQKATILSSDEYPNIQYVLSELEERIEELTYEVANIRDTELAKREVWRANVDLNAIEEKVEVLQKLSSSSFGNRRRSNFL
jgi:hypothetical protein